MRLKNIKEDINYDATRRFFQNRARKYKKENPYAVTMYQDNQPDLVVKRNQAEAEKILPMLQLDNNSRILDVACGIGRWSDLITTDISCYCGIDFCQQFIDIATEKNRSLVNRLFLCGNTGELSALLKTRQQYSFNRILMFGIAIYLNDDSLCTLYQQACEFSEKSSLICIREPIGIEGRLTLKEFYSQELDDMYNAIYRSRDEFLQVFKETFFPAGYVIKEEGFLFKDELNNRKETSQYYYLLSR